MSKRRVSVYLDRECRDRAIARVRYNEVLDRWNGSNWSNGGVGMHKGLSKLKDGRYVIIVGSQWQDGRDYGYVATISEVIGEVVFSDNYKDILRRFPELKKHILKKYL